MRLQKYLLPFVLINIQNNFVLNNQHLQTSQPLPFCNHLYVTIWLSYFTLSGYSTGTLERLLCVLSGLCRSLRVNSKLNMSSLSSPVQSERISKVKYAVNAYLINMHEVTACMQQINVLGFNWTRNMLVKIGPENVQELIKYMLTAG